MAHPRYEDNVRPPKEVRKATPAETFNGYKAVRAGMIGVTGNEVVLTA